MNKLFGNSINIAQKSLDYLWKKQSVITDNIANQDTPGYKSRYVTFEDELRSNLAKASQTDEKDYVKAVENTDFRINTTENESARMDGNNVNPDAEYVELARTTIQYQYAIRAVSDEFARLRTGKKSVTLLSSPTSCTTTLASAFPS